MEVTLINMIEKIRDSKLAGVAFHFCIAPPTR